MASSNYGRSKRPLRSQVRVMMP
ncbi:UNVERIFIED_CONTAM: hypothetical protein GTU68_056494 [Idotea baltica]|nr:hypothetical protein [Idotea baltica]